MKSPIRRRRVDQSTHEPELIQMTRRELRAERRSWTIVGALGALSFVLGAAVVLQPSDGKNEAKHQTTLPQREVTSDSLAVDIYLDGTILTGRVLNTASKLDCPALAPEIEDVFNQQKGVFSVIDADMVRFKSIIRSLTLDEIVQMSFSEEPCLIDGEPIHVPAADEITDPNSIEASVAELQYDFVQLGAYRISGNRGS